MALNLGGAAEKLILTIVIFIVGLAILAGTMGLIFENIGDVLVVFRDNASDLNNTVLEAIAGTLGLLIGVGFIFGVVQVASRLRPKG